MTESRLDRIMKERGSIQKVEIKANEEDLFLTGMIVSNEFMRGIFHVMEPRYFKSPHIRMVSIWALEYWDEFGVVPGSSIQDMFEVERRNNALADSELIEKLLLTISERFAGKEFNAGYLVPKMLSYCRERVVELTLEDAKWNLDKKGPDAAWESLSKIKEVRQKTSKGVNFLRDFDMRMDGWYYANKTELMRMPGALGCYMAPLIRKKLIAFVAPPKRGKSWWLLYVAFIAATHKLNAAFFSLEMSEEEVEERLAMMMCAHEFGSGSEGYTLPVVDCQFNQDGSCTRSIRESHEESILDDDGNLPEYEDTPHIVCTACRRDWSNPNAGNERSEFEYAPWMDTIEQEKLSPKRIKRYMENFRMHFGQDALKIFTHRIGTATVADLEDNLDEEESLNGWVADVISVDYADITKKDSSKGDHRHQLSDIWEQLSGMMKERNALGFTASQGNRGSASKARLSVEDIAEDFGKVMIVDGLIAINEDNIGKERTAKDKYWQKQQLQWLAHRYKRDLREWEFCETLNALTLGQICIDSEITS